MELNKQYFLPECNVEAFNEASESNSKVSAFLNGQPFYVRKKKPSGSITEISFGNDRSLTPSDSFMDPTVLSSGIWIDHYEQQFFKEYKEPVDQNTDEKLYCVCYVAANGITKIDKGYTLDEAEAQAEKLLLNDATGAVQVFKSIACYTLTKTVNKVSHV